MWKAREPAGTEMCSQECKVQGMPKNRTLPQGMKIQETCLITDCINSEANVTLKCPSSTLSPPKTAQDQNKPNIELEDKPEMDVQSVNMSTTGSADPTPTIMKSVLAPILSEIQLRETVHLDYKKVAL